MDEGWWAALVTNSIFHFESSQIAGTRAPNSPAAPFRQFENTKVELQLQFFLPRTLVGFCLLHFCRRLGVKRFLCAYVFEMLKWCMAPGPDWNSFPPPICQFFFYTFPVCVKGECYKMSIKLFEETCWNALFAF